MAKTIYVDQVHHPFHYNQGRIEVIEVIEDWKLGFHLGNTVKYIARAGKKDVKTHVQDLEKAKWYLERFIEKLKWDQEQPPVPPMQPPMHQTTTSVNLNANSETISWRENDAA